MDIVITTALIPGRPAPELVKADTVAAMKPGAVIVDLAIEQGGNVEGAELGNIVVRNGVKIVGIPNLAATVPADASALYARNVLNFLALRSTRRPASSPMPATTRSSSATRVCADGQVVSRQAEPQTACRDRDGRAVAPRSRAAIQMQGSKPWPRVDPIVFYLIIFVLAICRRLPRGLERHAGAAHAADVGDQRDLRHHPRRRDARRRTRGVRLGRLGRRVAVALASVNVFGGFLVTQRMLEMFRKKEPKAPRGKQ